MAVTNFTKLGPYPKAYAGADQGGYYAFTNTTAGTGQVSGVVTSLANTTPYLLIKNNNPAGSGINLYMDYLQVLCTVAGVGHTGGPLWTFAVERAANLSRYTSGGAQFTPQNTRSDGANANGNALIYCGVLLAAAGGSVGTIASFLTKPGHIEIIGDTSRFDFGACEQQPQNGLADNSTTISHGLFNVPPVVIGPQTWLQVNYWGASMSTGTTFLVNGGYLEL